MSGAPLSPQGFAAAMAALGHPVSRETAAALAAYAALLEKWQRRINLVAPASLEDLWRRHMLDSAQLLPHLPPGAAAITDLGAGAGFPGLVLAAMSGRRVHLVESDQRKCAFLAEAARLLGLSERVTIHAARIEALPPWPAAIVTARALAPLARLLAWAAPFLGEASLCLFLKGRRWREELTEARRDWIMAAVEAIPSRTEPEAAILKIAGVARGGRRG